MEPIVLTHMERLAAIRAYNSRNKLELSRAQMIDFIIDSINKERAEATTSLT
jgi:hypothetical protein